MQTMTSKHTKADKSIGSEKKKAKIPKMVEHDEAPVALGEDIRVTIFAPRYLTEAYASVREAVKAAGPLTDAPSLQRVADANTRMRRGLRLLSRWYPSAERRTWARRLRELEAAIEPLLEADVVIGELQSVPRTAGANARRAIAFLVGRGMALREQQVVAALERVKQLDVDGRSRDFRRFATATKSASDRKARLREFAASTLSEHLDALESAASVSLADAGDEAWGALDVALRNALAALDLCADCYDTAAMGAVRSPLVTAEQAVSALRGIRAALVVVRSPETAIRAGAAGVGVDDLTQLASLFERRSERAVAAAIKVTEAVGSRESRALVLAPFASASAARTMTEESKAIVAVPDTTAVAVDTPVVVEPQAAAATPADEAVPKAAPRPAPKRAPRAPRPPAGG
jgi:hypothetical protein